MSGKVETIDYATEIIPASCHGLFFFSTQTSSTSDRLVASKIVTCSRMSDGGNADGISDSSDSANGVSDYDFFVSLRGSHAQPKIAQTGSAVFGSISLVLELFVLLASAWVYYHKVGRSALDRVSYRIMLWTMMVEVVYTSVNLAVSSILSCRRAKSGVRELKNVSSVILLRQVRHVVL